MDQEPTAIKTDALNRRDLVKLMAMGAAGALGLPALALAAGEKTLVWGKKLEATMYDPATSILASSWELLHLVYEGLTNLDANMKPVPALAESWETPSPTKYVFKLRRGVKFSNGRELTVDDAVGSLRRLIDPKTGSFFAGQMGKIKSISASGAHALTIELAEPYAPLLTALASTMASIIPMKELAAGSFDPSKTLLGTGPYAVQSHAQGDNWTLERNAHYWQPGLPKIARLVVKIVPNDQALIAGLRDGGIDIAQFDASPDAKLLLTPLANVQVVQNQQTNLIWLVLNAVAKGSPFANPKVRQAVALALDRDTIAKVGMGGSGAPATAIAPAFHAVDPARLKVYKRDVEKAKALLKEAGATGLGFEVVTGSEPIWAAIGQVMQESLAQAGITVKLATLDEGTLVKRVWIANPGDFQASLLWYAGYSDPAMLPLWFVPKVAGFTAGYQAEDPELIKAIEGLRALDAADPHRAAAIQDVCDRIHTQANQIPVITRVETMAFRKDVLQAAAMSHVDGYADSLHGVATYTKS
ncbi:MAG: ABC transporter substrate-binding protein [Burkholderiales bacterium]|nr:ABC transporter substrate-binding protein [Burkholderiales bacterium]